MRPTYGVGGVDLGPAAISYSTIDGTAPIDAGSYTATGTFTGSANYASATGTAPITIGQATATVVVYDVSVTYDGLAHGTTGEAYGVGGIDLGPAAISYNTADGTAPVDAGSYTATGAFAGDSNYTSATGTATITISQGTPTGPLVMGMSPTSGPTAGGTTVTINGSGFTGATFVYFGSTSAAFTVNSDTSISATSPAEPAGTVDVTVVTPGGTSATSSADQFTFLSQAPAISGLSPAHGPTDGGTVVTITGAYLTGTTAVYFGTSAATRFTVDSDSQITATAPLSNTVPGQVNVLVTTPAGTSDTSAATEFTYADPQTFDGAALAPGPDVGPLTSEELQSLVQEAIARWAAATGDAATADRLRQTTVHIADLPDNLLGLEANNTVWIDLNAAGHGWFLDLTPGTDEEFSIPVGGHALRAAPGSAAAGRVDLLTVLGHEFGHVLGLADLNAALVPHELMTEGLGAGVRGLPAWLTAPVGTPPGGLAGQAAQLAPPTPASGAAPPAAVMGALPQLPAGNAASPSAAGPPEAPVVVPAAPGGTTLPLPVLSDMGDDSGAVAGPGTPLPQPDAPAHAEVFAAAYRGTEEDGGTWLAAPPGALPLSPATPVTAGPAPDRNPVGITATVGPGGAVLVGGDGDSLVIGEHGGDVLVGGIPGEALPTRS